MQFLSSLSYSVSFESMVFSVTALTVKNTNDINTEIDFYFEAVGAS